MDAPRAAVLVVGLNLVAVWIAAAAGSAIRPSAPVQPPGTAEQRSVEQARAAIGEAQVRLEARDSRPPASPSGARNPFRFGHPARAASVHPSPYRGVGPGGPAAGAATAAPPAPELRLVGMAESKDGGAIRRTAIISAGGELVLATAGTELGGRYRVRAIGEASVELDDLLGGPPLILRLKS